MEAIRSSETSVVSYRPIRRQNSQARTLHSHCFENYKFNKVKSCMTIICVTLLDIINYITFAILESADVFLKVPLRFEILKFILQSLMIEYSTFIYDVSSNCSQYRIGSVTYMTPRRICIFRKPQNDSEMIRTIQKTVCRLLKGNASSSQSKFLFFTKWVEACSTSALEV
jgi:hypothetical protein